MTLTPPPFYLASTPRSGATLLAAMLNQHRSIAMFNEPWFFQLERKYGSMRHRGNVCRLVADLAHAAQGFGVPMDRKLLAEIEQQILASSDSKPLAGFTYFLDRYTAAQGKRRWGVKQPHGILNAPRLMAHRTEIQFVHIIRDPRATVAYRMGKPSNPKENLTQALRFARSWHQLSTFPTQIGALDTNNYREILYEDLVREPERVLRRICSFLGEAYDPSMLDYHQANKPYVPRDPDGSPKSTHTGVLRPVYTHEVDAWQELLSPRELELVESVCREPMAARGYRQVASGGQLAAGTLTVTHLRLRWQLLRRRLRTDVLERLFHLSRRAWTVLLPAALRKERIL